MILQFDIPNTSVTLSITLFLHLFLDAYPEAEEGNGE